MDPTGKEGPHIGLDEQGAPQMKRSRFPIPVRVTDMPEDLGKLLDMGLKEHFCGR
jgi:hypothetical protein